MPFFISHTQIHTYISEICNPSIKISSDWSASVPACNEHRFDAKKRLAISNFKFIGAAVTARSILSLSDYQTLFRVGSQRSLQAGTLALQSNLIIKAIPEILKKF